MCIRIYWKFGLNLQHLQNTIFISHQCFNYMEFMNVYLDRRIFSVNFNIVIATNQLGLSTLLDRHPHFEV